MFCNGQLSILILSVNYVKTLLKRQRLFGWPSCLLFYYSSSLNAQMYNKFDQKEVSSYKNFESYFSRPLTFNMI